MDTSKNKVLILNNELVKTVNWEDHKDDYDVCLHSLNHDADEFIIINPDYAKEIRQIISNNIDFSITSQRCIVWTHKNNWVAKKFRKLWRIEDSWDYHEFKFDLEWFVNPLFDHQTISIDNIKKFIPDIHDLMYEFVWYLKIDDGEEKIWVVKCKTAWSSKILKEIGYVTLDNIQKTECNPDLAHLKFDWPKTQVGLGKGVYEHIWYLDPKYSTNEKIWVKKVRYVDNPIGTIDCGHVIPQEIHIKSNPDLAHLEFNVDINLPAYDLQYKNIWFLDPSLISDKKEIWVKSITALRRPQGTKNQGYIRPNISTCPDVVFISYHEVNAEKNWQRVLDIFPNAKRVENIDGILAAHKMAAEVATTDVFYVVDGDAYLVDEWDFSFCPNLFERKFIHVFRSINPVNGLTYGYGGIKLFPKKLLLNANVWKIDLTTSIGTGVKVIDKVSNVTEFNTDAFSAWRSGFRECVKLSSRSINNQLDQETQKRLDIWCTVGVDKQYGQQCLDGANAGRQYGIKNMGNTEALAKINNFNWINEVYKKYYGF